MAQLSGNVVLVAHKCLDYDAKVLLRNLEEFDIPYEETILGFSDSLFASRWEANHFLRYFYPKVLTAGTVGTNLTENGYRYLPYLPTCLIVWI